jgi:hypothetical protein
MGQDRSPPETRHDSEGSSGTRATAPGAHHVSGGFPGHTRNSWGNTGRLAAGRGICTFGTRESAQWGPIEGYERPLPSAAPIPAHMVRKSKSRLDLLTTTTISTDAVLPRGCLRKASRIRRFKRFRSTAPPKLLLTAMPSRAYPSPLSQTRNTKSPRRTALPLENTRWNSLGARSRRARGNPSLDAHPRTADGTGTSTHTLRRRLPLSRRLCRTARPARVLMRTRNPCVLLRRRLLG